MSERGIYDPPGEEEVERIVSDFYKWSPHLSVAENERREIKAERDAAVGRAEAAEVRAIKAADEIRLLTARLAVADESIARYREDMASDDARISELEAERSIALAMYLAPRDGRFWSLLHGESYATMAEAEAGVIHELKRRQEGGER